MSNNGCSKWRSTNDNCRQSPGNHGHAEIKQPIEKKSLKKADLKNRPDIGSCHLYCGTLRPPERDKHHPRKHEANTGKGKGITITQADLHPDKSC